MKTALGALSLIILLTLSTASVAQTRRRGTTHKILQDTGAFLLGHEANLAFA